MNYKNIIITALLLSVVSIFSGADGYHHLPDKGHQNYKHQKKTGIWLEMNFRTVMIKDKAVHFIVSSSLDEENSFEGPGPYSGYNLFDDDRNTAWVEGVKGQGMGEYVIAATGYHLPATIIIDNGYQKSERLYKMNSRPRTVKLSMYAGFFLEGDETEIASRYRLKKVAGAADIELEDRMGSMCIELPFSKTKVRQRSDSLAAVFKSDFSDEIEQRKEWCPTCDTIIRSGYFIKLEITDVYEGGEWDDTCISGLDFLTVTGKTKYGAIKPEDKILKVYQSDDPDAGIIYVDTEKRKGIVLVDKRTLKEYHDLPYNMNMDIILMDVSPDNEWAQVDLLFYEEGASRAEEYSVIYNLRMLERVDESIFETRYGISGFVEDKGKVWLNTVNGYIDLNKIKQKMLCRQKDAGQIQ